jgi:hypothetical protein
MSMVRCPDCGGPMEWVPCEQCDGDGCIDCFCVGGDYECPDDLCYEVSTMEAD